MSSRNRTPSQIIGYGLYLYFLGLSFRNTAKALSFLLLVRISHVSIWKWLQKYRPRKYLKKKKINEYIIDETAIKAGSELIWLWAIIESKNKEILATNISKKRSISIAKRFLYYMRLGHNSILLIFIHYSVSSSPKHILYRSWIYFLSFTVVVYHYLI